MILKLKFKTLRLLSIFICISFFIGPPFSTALGAETVIPRYDLFELAFKGGDYVNPYSDAPTTEVRLLGPNLSAFSIEAFWNGGNEWRFRFAPPQAGHWKYRVYSADKHLNGISGTFTVSNKIGGLNNHGFIEVDSNRPHKFRYTDGTPFFFLGQSIEWYRQASLSSGEYQNIVQSRANQGFTVLVGYAGPTLGKPIFSSNESGPPFFNSSLDEIGLEYFKEVDRRLQIAIDNGLAVTFALSFADQAIWNLNKIKLERAWKYTIARYAAFPIFWQPIGEYDEGPERKAVAFGKLTKEKDPYGHPLSMHPRNTSAGLAGEPWFDFIIHQTLNVEAPVELIREENRLNLPIVEEEHRIFDPDQVRKAAWRHYTNGAFYTLTRANYVIFDKRVMYLRFLQNFFKSINFNALRPHPNLVDQGDCLAYPGKEYVIYLPDGGSVTVDLSDATNRLKIQWFNPRTGVMSQGKQFIAKGKNRFSAPDRNDWVLHLKDRHF